MRKIKIVFKLLLGSVIILIFARNVSAHEMWYEPGIGSAPLIFNSTNSSGGPAIRVYYYHIQDNNAPASYFSLAPSAIASWNNIGLYGIYVTNEYQSQSTSTGSNIRFYVSPTIWQTYNLGTYTAAFTKPYDTNYQHIDSFNDANNSSGVVLYANIYMNPSDEEFKQFTTNSTVINNRIKMTMVHEIGHAIGLGHSDRSYDNPISSSTYSIMRQAFPDTANTGIVPATHERIDIVGKYN